MDFDGLYASVREIVKNLPEEKRVAEAEYHRRLEICRKCDFLNNGICGKCGCFVELRTAKTNMSCPHEKHFW